MRICGNKRIENPLDTGNQFFPEFGGIGPVYGGKPVRFMTGSGIAPL